MPKKDRRYYIKNSHGSGNVSMDGPFDSSVLRQKVLAGQLAPTSELYDAEDNSTVTAASLFPELGAALGNGFSPPPRPLVIKAKGDALLSAALSKNTPVVENTAHIEKKQAYFVKLKPVAAKAAKNEDENGGGKKNLRDFTRSIIREGKRFKMYSAQRLNPFANGSTMLSASLALIAVGVYGFIHFKDDSRARGLAGKGVDVAPAATSGSGTGAPARTSGGGAGSSEMPLATGDAIGKGNNPVNRDVGATVTNAVSAAAAPKDVAATPTEANPTPTPEPLPITQNHPAADPNRDPAQIPTPQNGDGGAQYGDGGQNPGAPSPGGEVYHLDPSATQIDTSAPVTPPNFSNSYADPAASQPIPDPASVPNGEPASDGSMVYDPNAVPPPSPDPEAGTTY